MVAHWRRVLPLIVLAVLLLYEDRVSIPSCEVVPSGEPAEVKGHPDDLRAMMVSDLLLLGSEAGSWDVIFRDYYMSKFFRKSYEMLKPDLLLILGDVSARGSELKRSEWSYLVQQLHRLLGPFLALPFHVTLGDRDIGECSGLDEIYVHQIARNFPALDSAGCGAFKIANISFVSLNTVALLCGNSKLRFSVEKLIEQESIYLQPESSQTTEVQKSAELELASVNFGWRENAVSSGSGPVLLLHFPLHRTVNNQWYGSNTYQKTSSFSLKSSRLLTSGRINACGPYDLSRTLMPNVTEYIFQALRPRIVFSAHAHEFCDWTHSDGTREVTIPGMAWGMKDDPGFVFATFRRNGSIITVSRCSLTGEFYVLVAYISVVILLMLSLFVANTPRQIISRRQ